MSARPDKNEISNVLEHAYDDDLIAADHSAAIFYSTSHLQNRMAECKAAFPARSLHAIAIKALPFPKLLTHFQKAGWGAEAASHGELEIALASGFLPENIVFDSPAKTRIELDYALSLGCHVNADSFGELERIASLLRVNPKFPAQSIGLRVNPQVGTGTIKTTSVAGNYSKFGVPLKEQSEQIVAAYKQYPWLDSIHFHIGSQGCSINMLVKGAQEIDNLIKRINMERGQPIHTIDMGGGLPTTYYFDKSVPSFNDYAQSLFSALPDWSDNSRYRLITEFGRHIAANAAWAVSNIEYVKPADGVHTIISHLGADMFLRKCYRPDEWHHEMSILDRRENRFLKPGSTKVRVAGPLCFASDIIGEIKTNEVPTEDQKLIIHDVGAYTISMWSRYNSRPMPGVYEYSFKSGEQKISVIKEPESAKDLVGFWC